jgi:alkylation response protein AidB-like acyl-CoA dehydrogenase
VAGSGRRPPLLSSLDLDDLAQLDLSLSVGELEMIRVVRNFAERSLAPAAKDCEHDNRYPHDLVEQARQLGLFGLVIPSEYDGLGASHKFLAIAFEEISRIWAGFAGILGTHTMLTRVLNDFGTDEQRQRYLPRLASGELRGGTAITEPDAGSDVQAIRTTARRVEGGYVLRGRKTFLTNGAHGNIFLIVAKTDPKAKPAHTGISLFLAEKGERFVVTGEIEKLGYKPVDTVEVELDDHLVGADALIGGVEGKGFRQIMTGLESGRINIAGRAVGVARAAFEEALAYSQQRSAFGRLIAKHQAVQLMLADMATKVEAARLLTLRAAQAADRGDRADLEAGMAKLFASEFCAQVCLDAMRVHGGYGYTKDFLVERFYRDAPLMIIGEGTNEIQRLVIARNLLKRHRLD